MSKIEKAVELLEKFVKEGMDYADAEFRAAQRFELSDKATDKMIKLWNERN